jgi:hypothetical protein
MLSDGKFLSEFISIMYNKWCFVDILFWFSHLTMFLQITTWICLVHHCWTPVRWFLVVNEKLLHCCTAQTVAQQYYLKSMSRTSWPIYDFWLYQLQFLTNSADHFSVGLPEGPGIWGNMNTSLVVYYTTACQHHTGKSVYPVSNRSCPVNRFQNSCSNDIITWLCLPESRLG